MPTCTPTPVVIDGVFDAASAGGVRSPNYAKDMTIVRLFATVIVAAPRWIRRGCVRTAPVPGVSNKLAARPDFALSGRSPL